MSDFKDKINSFKNHELLLGQLLNDEVSFYSELKTDIYSHPYYSTFRKKIEALYLNVYKENRFVNVYLGKFPSTVEICETIFSTLSNIFDSQNKNITVSVENQKDEEIISELKPFYEYFKNEGWKAVQTLFNSFLCVDINENQEYYLYNIAPQFVRYIDFDDDNEIEEIIFSFDNEKYYYYTKDFYSVYEKNESTYVLEKETTHELGKCPVRVFLNDKLNNSSKFLSKNVIVSQLPDLFRYVKKSVELEMSEDFTSSPIKIMPDQSCGYHISKEVISNNSDVPVIIEVSCKGGRLYESNPQFQNGDLPVLEGNTQMLCPVCGQNRHVGTGASFTIDYQQAADSNINVNDFIKFFSPPLDGTNYQKERLKELYNSIIESTVGNVTIGTKEARNEMDVMSGYEKTTKILTSFGEIYAQTIEWSFEIYLRLKYGKSFNYVNVFLGNKFYLLTKEELFKAKEVATNPIELAEIDRQILRLEYKHDPRKLLELSKIYEQLPYSGISDKDFLQLIQLGKVSDFDIEKRTNINYYIAEFERQNLNKPEVLDYNYINNEINNLVNKKLQQYANT